MKTDFNNIFFMPIAADLNYIIEHTTVLWEELRNRRIFITGGTGFFGKWLLASFCWANKKLDLNAHATVLTRNKAGFRKEHPFLFNNSALSFYEGNVINFIYPNSDFYCVIHAATDGGIKFKTLADKTMLETIIDGTRHTLEFAKFCQAKKFLFISSGAVYGKNNNLMPFLSEEKLCQFDPMCSGSAYALGKLLAEFLCTLHAENQLEIKIARCFASLGPHQPLNVHFALGNFILNKLNNEDILIKGDGTPYRSYLYIADLCIWLWSILFMGKNLTPYNVGSNESYSLLEVANIVAQEMDTKVKVKRLQSPLRDAIPESYVPDITRIHEDLGLYPKINLREAIQKTIQFYHKMPIYS